MLLYHPASHTVQISFVYYLSASAQGRTWALSGMKQPFTKYSIDGSYSVPGLGKTSVFGCIYILHQNKYPTFSICAACRYLNFVVFKSLYSSLLHSPNVPSLFTPVTRWTEIVAERSSSLPEQREHCPGKDVCFAVYAKRS